MLLVVFVKRLYVKQSNNNLKKMRRQKSEERRKEISRTTIARGRRTRRHAATRRGSFCFLFGSECEHHRREGVNEEDETSAIALLGVPEVQSQEDSEEEGGR